MECKEFAKLIAERFDEAELFTRRFGSFSKADYEILMFSIYLDMQTEPVRDYDISIALGMTETKVRSLRIKSQLLYPRTISWCDELQKALTKGQYNPDKMTITVMIEDPSVQNLLKSKIESAYGTRLPITNAPSVMVGYIEIPVTSQQTSIPNAGRIEWKKMRVRLKNRVRIISTISILISAVLILLI